MDQETSMKQAANTEKLLYAGFFLGLLFNIEDGSNMFLRNVGRLSTDHMLLHPTVVRYPVYLNCS
jgi:hypothetical protein